ncbi:heterokaryon incompatibility protein-domain-containing protein [Nemania serpens]|nr:heterokaryon incompatibility protein-domain-containing protein [Nemania serpens]
MEEDCIATAPNKRRSENLHDKLPSTLCKDCSQLDLSKLQELNNGSYVQGGDGAPQKSETFGFRKVCLANVGDKYWKSPANNCALCSALYANRNPWQLGRRRAYSFEKVESVPEKLYGFPLYLRRGGRDGYRLGGDCPSILALIPDVGEDSRYAALWWTNEDNRDKHTVSNRDDIWKALPRVFPEKGYLICYRATDTTWDTNVSNSSPISPTFNASIPRAWLLDCIENHKKCKPAGHRANAINLIDCATRQIVPATSDVPYVALSYVWGESKSIQVERCASGSLCLPVTLPRFMTDAINVTEMLGIRFLWIDQACIDQQNQDEKYKQIQNMDAIYSNAEITLVATSQRYTHDGLPGAPGRPREPSDGILLAHGEYVIRSVPRHPEELVGDLEWSTRAWTYQEGLCSRRNLYFTDHELFYECRCSRQCESLGLSGLPSLGSRLACPLPRIYENGPQFRPGKAISKYKGLVTNLDNVGKVITNYLDTVEVYTSRRLTNPADVLDAFVAMSNLHKRSALDCISQHGPEYAVQSIQGFLLPNSASPHGDRWLLNMLSFYHEPKSNSRRRDGFPSWSWVGWIGTVRYGFREPGTWRGIHQLYCMIHPRDGELLLTNVFVEEVSPIHAESWAVPIYAAESLTKPSILAFDALRITDQVISAYREVRTYDEPFAYLSGETDDKLFEKGMDDGRYEVVLIGKSVRRFVGLILQPASTAGFFERAGILYIQISLLECDLPTLPPEPGYLRREYNVSELQGRMRRWKVV